MIRTRETTSYRGFEGEKEERKGGGREREKGGESLKERNGGKRTLIV